MGKRPTIADIAKETGLGVATIDRALNGRPNVSERTLLRVARAAEKLGYHATRLAHLRVDDAVRPKLKFAFILQKQHQDFYRSVAARLRVACDARPDYRIEADIHFIESQSPSNYTAMIHTAAEEADAQAVVAPNFPEVEEAIRVVRANGTPVFTLLNDFTQNGRVGHFGMDSMKVGRIAAWMLTTQIKIPGKLAIFVGHTRWHSHMLREAGFQTYLRQNAPEFELLPVLLSLDTRQLTQEALVSLLQQHSDVKGIYVAGGGMEGAIAALRELRPPGRIALVVHELTDTSKKALMDRYASLVIDTPVTEIAENVVEAMVRAATGKSDSAAGFFEPRLLCPESV